MQTTEQRIHIEEGNGEAIPATAPSAAAPKTEKTSGHAPLWQRIVGGITLVTVLGAFCGYIIFGVQFPGLMARGRDDTADAVAKKDFLSAPGVSLVKGKPHTLFVPEDVQVVLGMRKGVRQMVAVAEPPTEMRPLVLSGSTALDPVRLARIRARFAPARVVQIGQVHDFSSKTGETEFRELRPGDRVEKGQVLGVLYSVDVGSRKNDLLDALVQLIMDQRILDNADKHREAVPEVFMLGQVRAVQGDRNTIDRAYNNLKVWDIPQDEIDALHAEAKRITADEKGWLQTPAGKWYKGDKQKESNKDNPWGKVTLRAPFDGVIVERNLHQDEMVVDNTVNLFQIADVNRLLVIANAPEDELPTLEALDRQHRWWCIRTVGATDTSVLHGRIEEIGYLIDPNQHTAVIKGYVENPGQRLRAGQYVAATVRIPPPKDVVAIPIDALVEDGRQSLVFVQPDPAKPQFTMRRVQVTNRFENRVFVSSAPIPKEEQLTAKEAEEGLLAKGPLRPGERVLESGAGELKAVLLSEESEAVANGFSGVSR